MARLPLELFFAPSFCWPVVHHPNLSTSGAILRLNLLTLKKMLVISAGKNPVKRRIWEDAFSVELAKHDVEATPSYRLFPDAVPDTDQVIQIVRFEWLRRSPGHPMASS